MDIPQDKTSPPPQITRESSSRFIKGMGCVDTKMKILLDADKLLFQTETGQEPQAV